MKCPNCNNGEIKEDFSLTGIVFTRKKVYTYFCPICDFSNEKIIKISENEYQAELNKKIKTKEYKWHTERKEDINYGR